MNDFSIPMTITWPQPKACARCGSDFLAGDLLFPYWKAARGRKMRTWSGRFGDAMPPRKNYFLDGDAMGLTQWYHKKCVPPSIFHKVAAAAPSRDNHGPSETSTEDAGGISE